MPRHLTPSDRDRIAQLKQSGFDQQTIANKLDRSPSTISRELRRNSISGEYLPAQAQEQAESRRRNRPLTRKMDRPELNCFVRRCLTQEWSPEQIAGRAKCDHPDNRRRQVSSQTIYNWIKGDRDRSHWEGFLRRRGKRPCRRDYSKRDADKARIDQRPEEAEGRIRIGDWEGDTVLGPPGTGGLATLVDRKTRYTLIVKIRCKQADHVHGKIRDRFKSLTDEQRRTLTLDNGSEFARCHRLESHLGLSIYYAEPGRPYERGTNENTNGLIRQYFPKGTNFQTVTHSEIREVEEKLNNRPRACLGFRTPKELFLEEFSPNDCV